MITTAIKQGVPVIDAYHMASYNIARYYNMEHIHGSIGTGRIANINILEIKENPVPTSGIAKGKWVKRDGVNTHKALHIDWGKCKVTPLSLDWSIEKEDMLIAFHRVKELGGGMVIAEKNEVLHEIALPLLGIMSNLKMSELIQEEKQMVKLLQERGYAYDDPAFTILFFSATHLPFIRVTPIGLYDVKSGKVVASPVNLIK